MKLRDALQAVYDAHGLLTPALVVEVARDGDDAVAQCLHDALPWDADEALEQYQLVVARKLIRRQKINYRPSPHAKLRETRAFVSVQTGSGRSYEPTEAVAQDPLMARLMLAEAERMWRDLKARYGGLKGFVEMIRADIDGGEEHREAA